MSAEIINLPKRPAKQNVPDGGTTRRRRPPAPLILAAEQSVRLLRLALENPLPGRAARSRRNVDHTILKIVIKELEESIAAHCSEHAHSIGQMFLLALGPDLTVDAVQGARRTLQMLANALVIERPSA
jgi:hypothetical protein